MCAEETEEQPIIGFVSVVCYVRQLQEEEPTRFCAEVPLSVRLGLASIMLGVWLVYVPHRSAHRYTRLARHPRISFAFMRPDDSLDP